MDGGTALEDLLASLRRFVADREWEHLHDPKNLAMAVAGEAGELVAELRWLTTDEVRTLSADRRDRVTDEAADVLIFLLYLADELDVDLIAAANAKVQRNEGRFPAQGE